MEEKHRNKANTSSSRNTYSSNGGGRGSPSSSSYKVKQGAGRGSAVNHVSSSMSSSSPLTDADRVGITGLSDEHWILLKQMLEERNRTSTDQHSGTFFLESWIIDSGAINHMTGTLGFLRDVCDMPPVLIKLPDGRFTTATKQGRVHMGSSLDLHEVFFVDGLVCHLISVSQLTRARHCIF